MRIVGLIVALATVVAAIAFGSPIAHFLSIPSAIVVCGVGFGSGVFAHGAVGVVLLFYGTFGEVESGQAPLVAEVARTASRSFPAAGLLGTLIGIVQMLGNLEDPSKIGPALAVALLSLFYGYLATVLLWTPTEQRMASVAATPGTSSPQT